MTRGFVGPIFCGNWRARVICWCPRKKLGIWCAFDAHQNFARFSKNQAKFCKLFLIFKILLDFQNFAQFSKFFPIFKILPNIQNSSQFSKFFQIFKILPNFQNFTKFSKFCQIFKILSDFQNFAWFSNFCPIFKILPDFQNFAWFSTFFQNFAQSSKFCLIFKFLTDFQIFAWFSKLCLIFKIFHHFQNFAPFSKCYPIFKIFKMCITRVINIQQLYKALKMYLTTQWRAKLQNDGQNYKMMDDFQKNARIRQATWAHCVWTSAWGEGVNLKNILFISWIQWQYLPVFYSHLNMYSRVVSCIAWAS